MPTSGDNRDQTLLKEGRKNKLEDVEVSLREQVVEKLVDKLEELEEGKRTKEIWTTGNARRSDWLTRQAKFLAQYDEFLEPIYDQPQDWQSNLHLPVIYTVVKTVHARMLGALLEIDPLFSLKARTGANEQRAPLIQEVMNYTLKSWCNNYAGVEAEVDAWIWRWATMGCGILKSGWERRYQSFPDIVEEMEPVSVVELDEQGNEVTRQVMKMVEREKEVVQKDYDGPMLRNVDPEDVLIVGGKGDPQEADEVLHRDFLTAGELWSLVDQKLFREEAVEKVIEWGESRIGSDISDTIKIRRAQNAGTMDPNSTIDAPRYAVLERWAKIDVNGSGIPADVVLWVHDETGAILRATYVKRINKAGKRPFHKIDFHKRHGEDYGSGLAELLHTLATEIDAIHNMKIDFGLISSMPFGYYRATSSLKEEKIPLEPGVMIPMDNPQADVFFPQLGNKAAFTAQEEQFLMGQIERVTSISDLNLGIIGGQGATRTATGTRALVAESNSNLNVFLRRLNRGWKSALVYLFGQLQDKLPDGFEFRLTGDDGASYFRQVQSREELSGMYDFELEANSANSNKSVQEAVAAEIYQLTGNPLDIQLGIVTPLQRYEALKNLLMSRGVKDFGRFLQKPNGIQRIFTPQEIADRVLRGIDVPLTPEQDLQGFIAYFQEILSTDELLGQFNEEQTIKLAQKAKEAESMLRAMQQQAAQAANQQQMAMNQSMGSQPAALPFNAPTGGMIGET